MSRIIYILPNSFNPYLHHWYMRYGQKISLTPSFLLQFTHIQDMAEYLPVKYGCMIKSTGDLQQAVRKTNNTLLNF